jgi:hypothetical protein
MDKSLMVEIIAYAPTAFYHCTHCEVAWRETGVSNRLHDEQVNSSLPADLAQDYQALSDWVRAIFQSYGDQIILKVIDAASVEGFYKSLRYRVRHFPAIVVAGHSRFSGGNFEAAGKEIESLIAQEVRNHG